MSVPATNTSRARSFVPTAQMRLRKTRGAALAWLLVICTVVIGNVGRPHMIDRFRVVPAAYVVFRRRAGLGGQVLLQLRRGTGYMDEHWACAAAGHVESDESVLETACRESLEELGITIDPTDLRPLCAMHRIQEAGCVGQRVDFFFECSWWSGAPRLLEADKAAELRWFDLDALPTPVVPHELLVLGTLVDGGPAPIVTFGF